MLAAQAEATFARPTHACSPPALQPPHRNQPERESSPALHKKRAYPCGKDETDSWFSLDLPAMGFLLSTLLELRTSSSTPAVERCRGAPCHRANDCVQTMIVPCRQETASSRFATDRPRPHEQPTTFNAFRLRHHHTSVVSRNATVDSCRMHFSASRCVDATTRHGLRLLEAPFETSSSSSCSFAVASARPARPLPSNFPITPCDFPCRGVFSPGLGPYSSRITGLHTLIFSSDCWLVTSSCLVFSTLSLWLPSSIPSPSPLLETWRPQHNLRDGGVPASTIYSCPRPLHCLQPSG